MRLIVAFFNAEVFGHNWDAYAAFASPVLHPMTSPSLLSIGVFRNDGRAVQQRPLTFAHELFAAVSAVVLGQAHVRTLKEFKNDQCTLEAILPREYLNGVPTVELLRLLVKLAPTMRRCRVDPQLGLILFVITLDGILKLDVWSHADTLLVEEFNTSLGRGIKGILALNREYDSQALQCL